MLLFYVFVLKYPLLISLLNSFAVCLSVCLSKFKSYRDFSDVFTLVTVQFVVINMVAKIDLVVAFQCRNPYFDSAVNLKENINLVDSNDGLRPLIIYLPDRLNLATKYCPFGMDSHHSCSLGIANRAAGIN